MKEPMNLWVMLAIMLAVTAVSYLIVGTLIWFLIHGIHWS